ncbi:hypothetical protein J437_LFUL013206 [Ladona fulva]|uniref:PiggyBac transposable element-derived protein domain-containing protein n=1 Tax=Ladona fulva TaxID=123851 RepID=A0A8K0KGS6_LADFU|nr:hypothetical protein J437_LFUL013206 [Ladona fulva]
MTDTEIESSSDELWVLETEMEEDSAREDTDEDDDLGNAIKVYMLAESSGTVMQQIVYTGAGDQEVGGAGHIDCVVMKLLEKYKELGHSVYMDNYFNSVNLVRQLKCVKLHCTGTLRKNRRNNPKDVTEAKLRRNEYICRWTDDGI